MKESKKPKLYFTLRDAKQANACEEGLDMLYKYLKENKISYDDDSKFNVLMLLESNNIDHLWWSLRNCIKNQDADLKLVVVEVARRAANRVKIYAAAAAAAAADADASAYASDAASDAAAADAYAAYAAAAAASSSAVASSAAYASASAYSSASASASASAAYASAAAERKKQANDFTDLLDDGEIK